MSLIDKFHESAERSHLCNFDPETARRQLRVSLMLVAAMAVAAFVLGFALPFNGTRPPPDKPGASGDNGFSGRLVTINER